MLTYKDFADEVKSEALDEEAATGLAAKAAKSGVSVSVLRKVYNRGMAAWNSGHRPGTTPQQWGMARVNSYITKGEGTYHGADKDLREAVAKDSESGLPKAYVAGVSKTTAKARAAHFRKADKLSDRDPAAYKPAPGDTTSKTKESVHTKKYRRMYGEAKDSREYGYEGDMAMSQLKAIMRHAEQLHDLLEPDTDLPEWVQSKITLAYDYIQTAADYMATELDEEMSPQEAHHRKHGYYSYKLKAPSVDDAIGHAMNTITAKYGKKKKATPVAEATYKGKTVKLNKPMAGDVKKSKVFVDPDGDGKAQKVNFGDKNLSIKKHIPDRKKSYCARSSGQGNLTNKTSANYWSRKAWDC
jgi:hypothetical protein